MSLIESERAALRLHAQQVETYEAERAAERVRLQAPFAARAAELFELQHRDAGPTDHPTIRRSRGLNSDEQRELFGYHDQVAAALSAYDFARKPRLTPWDTPKMVLDWLNEEEFSWSGRRDDLLHSYGGTYTDEQRRETTARRQKETYQELYRRLMSFVVLAPSVLLDITEASDPLIGIHRIKAWCVDALRPPVPSAAGGEPFTGFCAPSEIAKAIGNPGKAEAIRKALGRLLKENRLADGAWMENADPARGQAKILYKLSEVRPHLTRFLAAD